MHFFLSLGHEMSEVFCIFARNYSGEISANIPKHLQMCVFCCNFAGGIGKQFNFYSLFFI